MNDEKLIIVEQLPSIRERMQTMKAEVERRVAASESLVCTEDTVKAVKADRAENRKLLDYIKGQLKQAEEAILEPFKPIKEYCQLELISPLESLDEKQKEDISSIENGVIKKRCEDGLREYFAELCAVRHIEWLTFEQTGIKVDMASAKAKTPTRLRNQLKDFADGVAYSVDIISKRKDAAEVMAEFKVSLDAANAIFAVEGRHIRNKIETAVLESRSTIQEQEKESVRRVEALSPPVQIEPEKNVKCIFTVRTTKSKLKKLKEFMNMEGIIYE